VRHCAWVLILFWLAGCGKSPPVEKEGGAPAVRISHFYAARAQVARGEAVLLCYGVENAVSVRIEPPVQQLKPRYNRCFQVAPRHTTTYRLVAVGDGGATATHTVIIHVKTTPQPEPLQPDSPTLITLAQPPGP
jgi:hypothetical protein